MDSTAVHSPPRLYGRAGIWAPDMRIYRLQSAVIDKLQATLLPYDGTFSWHSCQMILSLRIEAQHAMDALGKVIQIATRVTEVLGLGHLAIFDVRAMTEDAFEAINPADQPVPMLVGLGEAADILGISKQQVNKLMKKPPFPQPTFRLRATPVWTEEQILIFASID